MSAKIIKELVRDHSIENLLAEMETQLDVLAEEGLLKPLKDYYKRSARKLNRLRIIDKFLNGAIEEHKEYFENSKITTNKLYTSGIISGFRKVLLHLHGK